MSGRHAEHLTFDFIVVGAGSSGCVVANRLSAVESNSVCLLEAGPSDLTPGIALKTRLPVGNVFLIPSSIYNWGYTFQGGPSVRHRKIPSHRGRLFGGSSSINGMIYVRGQPEDYDAWRDAGNEGWGWKDVLPYFLKHENWAGDPGPFHATGGELHVSRGRYLNPITTAFLNGAHELQYRANDDFNGENQLGFGPWDLTQHCGQRWSSARAFLHPALARRNLAAFPDAEVARILFDGKRVVGIEVRRDGRALTITARREVVLCAGAYNSPKLLLLSGIGDATALSKAGVRPFHHLPGVGKNLQDHPTAWIEMEDRLGKSAAFTWGTLPRYACAAFLYASKRSGPLTSNNVEAGGFVNTLRTDARPDVQFILMPSVRDPGRFLARRHGVSLLTVLLRPKSRGHLELSSSDPKDRPVLHPDFLTDSDDVGTLVRGMRLGRQILGASALRHLVGSEIAPGSEVSDDLDLEGYLRDTVATSYHPVGTCKMAPASDPESVVDQKLRVRGIDRLRVVDASIMPTIVSGNTNAPAMMIGERGAEFIAQG